LRHQGLGEAQRKMLKLAPLIQFPADHLDPGPVGGAGTLHDDPVGGRVAAEYQRDADQAIVADDRQFGGGALAGGEDQ